MLGLPSTKLERAVKKAAQKRLADRAETCECVVRDVTARDALPEIVIAVQPSSRDVDITALHGNLTKPAKELSEEFGKEVKFALDSGSASSFQ
ncbi:MAG: hypothetical protein WD042_17125 [Phycisphaeraceae bacterium]